LRFCEKRDARDWIYGVRERERERDNMRTEENRSSQLTRTTFWS
jgi:hypothetical protein